jgi:hypothetical protein
MGFLHHLSPSSLQLKTTCTNSSSCPHQPIHERKNYGAFGLTSGFIGTQECFFPNCVVPHFFGYTDYRLRDHGCLIPIQESFINRTLEFTCWETSWNSLNTLIPSPYRVRHLSDQIKPNKRLIWTPRLRFSQSKQQIFIIFRGIERILPW